ncbi:tetratricopeptide repeat protein [Desulfitobacterium sp.]|uniref:tetratricopeptide repeat protein n=1 Tax=Desulfitobacterium sp. TaxID=49981 RepID=UPI002BEC0466|nr:tetratricopeptide repeat protein [Desulfitobacterium sp.]HVJ48056.1 tetratricopeptide repeat protein [Desulfitobacterium sp.]
MIQSPEPILTPKPFKTIKLWKELVILVGCALIIFAAGQFVGVKYFWNQFDKTPLTDKLYEGALAKVKSTPNDPNSYIDLGWALFQKGQYNEALAQYKKATELDDKSSRAYLNLGIAYRQVEKIDIAITSLQKAIELNPKSYEAHYYLGLTYQTNEKFDQALEELQSADKLHPGSSQIMYDIGQTNEKMGDVQGAKNEYNYALQYDPNFAKAKDALSRLGGGE